MCGNPVQLKCYINFTAYFWICLFPEGLYGCWRTYITANIPFLMHNSTNNVKSTKSNFGTLHTHMRKGINAVKQKTEKIVILTIFSFARNWIWSAGTFSTLAILFLNEPTVSLLCACKNHAQTSCNNYEQWHDAM